MSGHIGSTTGRPSLQLVYAVGQEAQIFIQRVSAGQVTKNRRAPDPQYLLQGSDGSVVRIDLNSLFKSPNTIGLSAGLEIDISQIEMEVRIPGVFPDGLQAEVDGLIDLTEFEGVDESVVGLALGTGGVLLKGLPQVGKGLRAQPLVEEPLALFKIVRFAHHAQLAPSLAEGLIILPEIRIPLYSEPPVRLRKKHV